MSDADYIKGACVHCNGRISFPAGALGSSIACPHCGKPTPLTDPNAAPDDTVKGACANCMGSQNTIKMLVEQALKDQIDQRIQVIEV